jgi:putative tryptophan/tyrosine transport system substrate-binding protein
LNETPRVHIAARRRGRLAALARKVLQGAKVTELPVERPTRFQLVANLKTAKLIGITLPASILLRADEVIE